jgi:hypothetical protein
LNPTILDDIWERPKSVAANLALAKELVLEEYAKMNVDEIGGMICLYRNIFFVES